MKADLTLTPVPDTVASWLEPFPCGQHDCRNCYGVATAVGLPLASPMSGIPQSWCTFAESFESEDDDASFTSETPQSVPSIIPSSETPPIVKPPVDPTEGSRICAWGGCSAVSSSQSELRVSLMGFRNPFNLNTNSNN